MPEPRSDSNKSLKFIIDRLKIAEQALNATATSLDVTDHRKIYLKALVTLLSKTIKHVPEISTFLTTSQQEALFYTLAINYELIHLDHEKERSYATGLKKGEELTIDAITKFYKFNKKQRAQICPHAIFLYNKNMYHYKHPDRLTTVSCYTEPTMSQNESMQRQKIYFGLQSMLRKMPKNTIKWAVGDAKMWMKNLNLTGIESNQDKGRPITFEVIETFASTIQMMLEETVTTWRETRQQRVREGALLGIGLLIAINVEILLTWMMYLVLGYTPVVLAHIFVTMEVVMIFPAILMALSLGVGLYCYVQETTLDAMLADVTTVRYQQEAPVPNGEVGQRNQLTITDSISTFFQLKRNELEPIELPFEADNPPLR